MSQRPLTSFHNSTNYVEKPPTIPGSVSISHGATQHLSVSQTKRNSVNRSRSLFNTYVMNGSNSAALSDVCNLRQFHYHPI